MSRSSFPVPLPDASEKSLNSKRELSYSRSHSGAHVSALTEAAVLGSLTESLLGGEVIENGDKSTEVPNMWSLDYVGLYTQYAAVGLLSGTSGTLLPLCSYVYEGDGNVCANASNIVYLAWSFKLFYALLTDTVRPFGMRRRPWMVFGWTGVLAILATLAFTAQHLTASSWLVLQMLIQVFVMFSDVPADGYSVELGQQEPPERRGQILATGQLIRFSCSTFAGVLQTFLLNGPTTNSSSCEISASQCWSWGLTVNQYYGLLFAFIAICFAPIVRLKEPDASLVPAPVLREFFADIWDTLKSLPCLYLMIFVVGNNALTNYLNITTIFMQYYIINLTNLQAGVDTITTYLGVSTAIWLFKTYLINRNWRMSQYGSTLFSTVLGLLWLLVFYNVGGTQDPWFTIFIDLDQNFAIGISQVLFSMAVIEIAKPGQEATTYELLVTAANAAATLSTVIATQLLTPLGAAGCTDEPCPADTVDITDAQTYNDSDGPARFTRYTLVLVGLSVFFCLLSTPFLPASKQQCADWQARGERAGSSSVRGFFSLTIAAITIIYGGSVSILLLIPSLSCEPIIGGSGC